MIRRVTARPVLLACAAAAALTASFRPGLPGEGRVFDLMLVVDITGSMMARDYIVDGAPASRLDMLRRALPGLLQQLPCGSQVGLSIFSERRSFVLFDPVEICAGYDPVTRAIGALDWRMAWEGDSYVLRGLTSALDTARDRGHGVVFFTDGHQAPPLAGRPLPGGDGTPGLIVGVGGLAPVPIPKFDDLGNETGFHQPDDVAQASSGWTPPTAAAGSDWDPRVDSPGSTRPGEEHLTRVHEATLRAQAGALGLGYAPLAPGTDLATRVMDHFPGRRVPVTRPLAGWLGLACLLLFGLAHAWRFAGRRPPPIPPNQRNERILNARHALFRPGRLGHGPGTLRRHG